MEARLLERIAGRTRVSRPSLSVLLDLRPAFDGFYGIPQETRLMFPLFLGLDGLAVTGLINHPSLVLARGPSRHRSGRRALTPARSLEKLSRVVASATPRVGRSGILRDKAMSALTFSWLQLLALLGARIPLDDFEGTEFGDFLWQALFRTTLPPAEFEQCRTARYASLWAPWSAMHATALIPWPRKYAKVDTSGYDVLVAQTPWPGNVAPQTRLVVRYHDSVPIYFPHTIKRPRLHNFLHWSALGENAKSAAFACVSEHSRTKLLQIFPELEQRSFVVHDCIADAYRLEPTTPEIVASIIACRLAAPTEPKSGTGHLRTSFYDGRPGQAGFRYLLVVGTLEPRKNHLGLLAAWEALRMNSTSQVALVFVGSSGWGNTHLLEAMRKLQGRGELFYLSGVPPSEMRHLYSAADAVVCPSVSEGFDLPSVEALRCGGVVAASDIPTHREILGEAAVYFDPYSTADMSDVLTRLLTTEDLRAELRRRAALRAPKFDKSAISDQWQQVFDYCRKISPGAV
jgi:glycosyltransferase involved in cell wall biosynthesis